MEKCCNTCLERDHCDMELYMTEDSKNCPYWIFDMYDVGDEFSEDVENKE